MHYQTIAPSKQFAGIVRHYWVLESDLPYTHYSMADSCPELLFHYRGIFDELLPLGQRQRSYTAGLNGATHQPRRFQVQQGFGIFGLYLYPHAIPLLFGLPGSALTNQLVSLDFLLQQEGPELEEKIGSAKSTCQRVRIMEGFMADKLRRHYQKAGPIDQSIHAILQGKGQARVKQLASDSCLSERQFERKFRDTTGLSPKLFSRIARFHAAMEEYGNAQKSLLDIALDCGYYDQSHFIRDFREFSGQQPKAFFSGSSPATAWRD